MPWQMLSVVSSSNNGRWAFLTVAFGEPFANCASAVLASHIDTKSASNKRICSSSLSDAAYMETQSVPTVKKTASVLFMLYLYTY